MIGRAAGKVDRQVADLWAAVALLLLAGAVLVRTIPAGLPSCPARLLTGLPCPACGSTRALAALLSGDVPGALALNPLVTVAVAILIAGGLAAPFWVRITRRAVGFPRPVPAAARIGPAAAILINWVYLAIRGI